MSEHRNPEHVLYIRIVPGQENDRQMRWNDIHFSRECIEEAGPRTANRPVLRECIDSLQAGDTLHVAAFVFLVRSFGDLYTIVEELVRKGVTVTFREENMTFATPDDLEPLYYYARLDRDLRHERKLNGILFAKSKGRMGRAPKLSPEQAEEIKRRVAEGEHKKALAREFKVAHETIYKLFRNN